MKRYEIEVHHSLTIAEIKAKLYDLLAEISEWDAIQKIAEDHIFVDFDEYGAHLYYNEESNHYYKDDFKDFDVLADRDFDIPVETVVGVICDYDNKIYSNECNSYWLLNGIIEELYSHSDDGGSFDEEHYKLYDLLETARSCFEALEEAKK